MKIVIIGAGPGGYTSALKSAKLGAEVTVIEKEEVGGTCLNLGCIPTKTILSSCKVFNKTKHASEYGIDITGTISANISKIMERKNKVLSTQVNGIRRLFKNWGVNLIEGKGKIISPNKIEVLKKDSSIEIVEADKIIISTGSRPASLPMLPFDNNLILSSNDCININSIPKSLIIMGAGVLGCEFACIFSELEVDTTVIESSSRIISGEDTEISDLLAKEFKKKKIKLLTNTKIEKVQKAENKVSVTTNTGKELIAEKLLIAIGRTFNTEDIGLEALGIIKGNRGQITVNNKMQTNIDNIYAIGDVVGKIMLAHVASKEGIIAAYNACGIVKEMDYSVVPSGIFTFPEIGSVGLRQQQSEEKNLKTKIGKFQFRLLGKAHAIGEIEGFVKIIADAQTDKILGVHIIGPNASDLVHEGAIAIKAGLTVKQLSSMIFAHPTLSEAIMGAGEDVHNSDIHRSILHRTHQ